MATKYIRIKVNSIVKSDQTTKRIIDFNYAKTYGDAVSTADLVLKRTNTTEDDADFVTGKPVQVWMSDTLTTGQVPESSANIVFDGYIENRDIENFKITLTCADRLVLTKWSETGVKQEYGVNTAIKTIFSNLVSIAATSTGKTINLSTASDTPSPVNLNRYSIENNNVYEKLWELSNIINWQFYFDPSDTYVSGGCIRFEPRGKPVNQSFYNKVASVGSPKDQNGNTVTWSGKTINVAGLIKWQSDSKDLTNNLTGIGGQTEITITSEQHTVTGGTNNYILSDSNAGGRNTDTQIYNITVLGDAVTLVQGVDYVVYASASPPGFINFPTPPSALGYSNLYFTYTYKFSAAAGSNTNDATSITNYIKRSKTVTKRNIISPTDISTYLGTLLSGFKDPISEISFESRDISITPIIGSLASIYDGIINRVIVSTGTPIPIITRTVKHWPQPTTTVTVSTKPLKYETQTQTYFDRIDKTDKELTATNAKPFFKMDGSTPIQGDVFFGKKSDGTIPELKTPVIHKLSTAPVALTEAQLYYNITSHLPFFYNGSAWTSFGTGTVTGSGTTDRIAKWGSSSGLTDSLWISQAPGSGGNLLPYNNGAQSIGDSTHNLADFYMDGSMYAPTSFIFKTNSTTRMTISNSFIDARYPLRQVSSDGGTVYSSWSSGTGSTAFDAAVGHIYITANESAHSIFLETSTTTRLTISDSSITTTVPIYFTSSATNINVSTGNMVFTVASGKKFQFVIS